MSDLCTPGENDVMFGGSRTLPVPQGNVRLFSLIEKRMHFYSVANKLERSEIISQISNEMKTTSPQAEFYQRDPRSGMYRKLPENKVVSNIQFNKLTFPSLYLIFLTMFRN
jgi:hypothetical protein